MWERERISDYLAFVHEKQQVLHWERERERISDCLAFVHGRQQVLHSKTPTQRKPTISYTLNEENFFFYVFSYKSDICHKSIINFFIKKTFIKGYQSYSLPNHLLGSW